MFAQNLTLAQILPFVVTLSANSNSKMKKIISPHFWAAGQLRLLRHHIYRGAVVGVRGAAVGARAQLSGSGAQLSAILVCIPTYVISAPLCMYCSSIYESDQGLVATGYSIYNIYYRYSNESKTESHKN